MLKTITEKYNIETLFQRNEEKLETVRQYRQVMFQNSKEYQEIYSKIETLLNEIKSTSEEMSDVASELSDLIMNLECACCSQAYKDGMADLMSAMTFNELKITECKRIDIAKKSDGAA